MSEMVFSDCKENITDSCSSDYSLSEVKNGSFDGLQSVCKNVKVCIEPLKSLQEQTVVTALPINNLAKASGSALLCTLANNPVTNESAICNVTESSMLISKSNANESKISFLTDSMLHEEQLLHDEGEKEAEQLKQLAIAKFKESTMETNLSQLNHLLEKSSIYANYLLDILETRKKSEEKKALKKEKKLQHYSVLVEKSAKLQETNNLKSKSKKRKSITALPSAKKKMKNDESGVEQANYQVGDRICVIKSYEDGEEELFPGKITDACFVKKKWKYQVKLQGQRSKKEWIEESMIVDDVTDIVDQNVKLPNPPAILISELKKIDKNLLLESKFHQGSEISEKFQTADMKRYFDGQKCPDAQPEYFTGGILRDYQVTGLQWLKVLFDNAVNGILADEMGLGKTIQCIAMICRLLKTGFQGPFLVCAPLSTVCNWILEFKKFAPQIPVLLYHGTAAERCILRSVISKRASSLNCSPVVVTSYEVLMRDRLALSKHVWDYLIVDEGHRLKNINCRLLKELKALTVTAKVLLTGTPLQNNLAELWSLLNFLLPEVFSDLNTFEAWFDLQEIQKTARAISSKQEEHIVVMLHKILAPFLLRRTKSDIDIELPPKRELLLFIPLTSNQSKLYQAIADRTIRKLLKRNDEKKMDFTSVCDFYDSLDDGGPVRAITRSSTIDFRISEEKRKYDFVDDDSVINVSLNNLMMQLRKCCNHPYLIKYPLIPGSDIFRVDEELVTTCGKMQLLDQMLPVLKQNGHKVLIFSQMTKILDILEDFCNFRKFNFFRLDGQTRCEYRQQYIDQFNSNPDTFLFLLSTRAGGLGINLTAADTVIIYDSDWNPQNDLQAQDRCHRIGQTRPVIIYRFVAANTVDQFMVERAEAKRVLERLVINQNKFKGKLDEDMKSTSSNAVESATLISMLQKFGADVLSDTIGDDELAKILDRKFVMSCSDSDLTCGVFQNIQ